jgi:hypothetical protein
VNLKLENLISYDLETGKSRHKFIDTLCIQTVILIKKKRKKPLLFCEKKLQNNLRLKYSHLLVLVTNSDEMGRLYNFEYWMSYGGADHDAFK